jgi:hypothetical protein
VVPLSKGFGYGIILGLGFAFALGMIGTTWALKRYHGEVSEPVSLCCFSRVDEGTVRCKPRKLSPQLAEQSSQVLSRLLSYLVGHGLRPFCNPPALPINMACLVNEDLIRQKFRR